MGQVTLLLLHLDGCDVIPPPPKEGQEPGPLPLPPSLSLSVPSPSPSPLSLSSFSPLSLPLFSPLSLPSFPSNSLHLWAALQVANEVIAPKTALEARHVVPGMWALHAALQRRGLEQRIRVKTPQHPGFLCDISPPSRRPMWCPPCGGPSPTSSALCHATRQASQPVSKPASQPASQLSPRTVTVSHRHNLRIPQYCTVQYSHRAVSCSALPPVPRLCAGSSLFLTTFPFWSLKYNPYSTVL